MWKSRSNRLLSLSRTLFILFAIFAYWIRAISTQWFMQACVFVMAPCAIVIVIGELFHRQIAFTPYHLLLFGMSGIFLMTSLYNRGIFITGMTVLVGFCALVILVYHLCRDTARAKHDRKRRVICFAILSLSLALFLPFFISFYNGNGWRLPWLVPSIPARGADKMIAIRKMQAFGYNRGWILSDLSVVTFVCSAMLVAGITPKDTQKEYLRCESRAICALIVVLSFILLMPAVYSVFLGRPVVIPGLPEPFGIESPGAFNERIRALQHPNLTSHYALLGLYSAIYCLYGHKRRMIKYALGIACIVFVLAIAHTQSRTTNITLGIGLGAMVFRWIFLRFKKRIWRVPVGLTAAVLVIVAVILSINSLFAVDVYLTIKLNATEQASSAPIAVDTQNQIVVQPESTATPSPEKIVIPSGSTSQYMYSRAIESGLFNVTGNGRGRVWREGIDYLIHHPKDMFLGMGAGDIIERFQEYNPARFNAYHLHNSLLEVLARGGIFMLLCLIAALFLLIKPTARLLTQRDPSDPGSFIFAVFIGMLLAVSMTEALLFVEISLCQLMFFYAASRSALY